MYVCVYMYISINEPLISEQGQEGVMFYIIYNKIRALLTNFLEIQVWGNQV